jgi:hypothetical protein
MRARHVVIRRLTEQTLAKATKLKKAERHWKREWAVPVLDEAVERQHTPGLHDLMAPTQRDVWQGVRHRLQLRSP